MEEQTQTPPDAGASEEQPIPAAAAERTSLLSDEQRLERLLRNLVKGLIAAVAVFAVIYFFGQRQSHVDQAPAIPDQAIASAEADVRAKPNDVTLRLSLATAYARGNRKEEALVQLKEILKVQPEFRPALLGLGQLMYEKGNYAESQSALQKYVASAGNGEFAGQDPQLEMGYYLLGLSESKLDHTAAAADAFARAVKIDPGDADAWFQLGNKSLELKRYKPALDAYQKAIAFVPSGWCEPYDGMAKSFQGIGDQAGANFASSMVRICNGGGLDSARPLRDLMTSKYVVGALFGLGLAAENDHDTTAALDFYQQLLSVDRTNIAALSAISRLGATPAPKPIAGK